MSTNSRFQAFSRWAFDAIESGDPAAAEPFVKATGMRPNVFLEQLKINGAAVVGEVLDKGSSAAPYGQADFEFLALVATGRSGGALQEAPFKRDGYLRDASDGWTDITPKGEQLLRRMGFDYQEDKGWAPVQRDAAAKRESATPKADSAPVPDMQLREADTRTLLNAMLHYMEAPERVDSDWLHASIQRHAAGLSLCTPAPKLEVLLDAPVVAQRKDDSPSPGM